MALGAQARAEGTTAVVAPDRHVRAGQIVSASDLRTVRVPEVRADRSFEDRAEVAGRTAARLLRKNRPISESQLEAPRAVSRGQQVVIVYRAGTLSVTTKGRAREDGAVGERIRVMNLGQRKSVTAEVIGEGRVRISGRGR